MDNNQQERQKLLVKNVKRDPANHESKEQAKRPDVLKVQFRNPYSDPTTEISNNTGALTLSKGETETLMKILRDAKGGA